MRAYERFLKYIRFDTASDEASETCPSTPGQRAFGEELARELRELGVEDARIDGHGYVYGSLPANAEGLPAIGLIAHIDTVGSVPCVPMNARIVRYGGGDIPLGETGGAVMRAADFPRLKDFVGHELIVTDGKTLLGADDKAGVAEIVTLCEALLADPSIPHGKVCVGFTPDEEIGRGADRFDVAGFGAEFAYTLDGGPLAEIEYENFNAANARVAVNGFSIHPGDAKGKLRNALLLAMEFHALLPPAEAPAHTEGYEGFYHLSDLTGNEDRARMRYIIRDHDDGKFAARKAYMERTARYLNEKYGEGTVELDMRDSYYNMKRMILPRMDIVERAADAMRAEGYEPKTIPIRGGTDGSRLSYMGLPCPNLSSGGMNLHGRFECVSVQEMDAIVRILTRIVGPRPPRA